LKESPGDPSNILETSLLASARRPDPRESRDTCLQDDGLCSCCICWRDLERQVVSRPAPCPDLVELISATRPEALAVRPRLDRSGRRRRFVVAHGDQASSTPTHAAEALRWGLSNVRLAVEMGKGVVAYEGPHRHSWTGPAAADGRR